MQQWDDWLGWRTVPPIVLFVVGLFRLARRNGARPWTLWSAVISLLAAPIERDIAQRENRALRADNDRLADREKKLDERVTELEAENQRLRDSARPWSGGSSKNGDGKSSSSSPPSSPTTRDPFTK